MTFLIANIGWAFFVSIILAVVFIVCFTEVVQHMLLANHIGSDMHDSWRDQHHTVYVRRNFYWHV